MTDFYEELREEVRLRDRYQLELQTNYFPVSIKESNRYQMEFYFFLPQSLRIEPQTYSKEQFYADQTSFIRFKTPSISFKQLVDPSSKRSPLAKIRRILAQGEGNSEAEEQISNELKLLGNIVRSGLRNRCREIADEVYLEGKRLTRLEKEVEGLAHDLIRLRDAYLAVLEALKRHPSAKLKQEGSYIDEFLSLTIEHYLTRLIDLLCQEELELNGLDWLRKVIRRESWHRTTKGYPSVLSEEDSLEEQEHFLYRRGLLKKFVMDALLLSFGRSQPAKQVMPYIGSLAAALAMLFYFTFFVLQGQVFVINSMPFILVTVLLYVLKDRIKDAAKTLFEKKAVTRYPDYRTTLYTPQSAVKIGSVEETFRFLDESQVPDDVAAFSRSFQDIEQEIEQDQQTVFCLKKELFLNGHLLKRGARRFEIKHIFRFHVERFLQKAGDPFHFYYTYDFEAQSVKAMKIPKVYYIPIVIRNTFKTSSGQVKVELKRVRLVIDKEGIKRIEQDLA
ncbi:MAG: putative rane protein [Chlamydiales bacterium]|nr:putative rane protein [Chlamydiales bacterium]